MNRWNINETVVKKKDPRPVFSFVFPLDVGFKTSQASAMLSLMRVLHSRTVLISGRVTGRRRVPFIGVWYEASITHTIHHNTQFYIFWFLWFSNTFDISFTFSVFLAFAFSLQQFHAAACLVAYCFFFFFFFWTLKMFNKNWSLRGQFSSPRITDVPRSSRAAQTSMRHFWRKCEKLSEPKGSGQSGWNMLTLPIFCNFLRPIWAPVIISGLLVASRSQWVHFLDFWTWYLSDWGMLRDGYDGVSRCLLLKSLASKCHSPMNHLPLCPLQLDFLYFCRAVFKKAKQMFTGSGNYLQTQHHGSFTLLEFLLDRQMLHDRTLKHREMKGRDNRILLIWAACLSDVGRLLCSQNHYKRASLYVINPCPAHSKPTFIARIAHIIFNQQGGCFLCILLFPTCSNPVWERRLTIPVDGSSGIRLAGGALGKVSRNGKVQRRKVERQLLS